MLQITWRTTIGIDTGKVAPCLGTTACKYVGSSGSVVSAAHVAQVVVIVLHHGVGEALVGGAVGGDFSTSLFICSTSSGTTNRAN